MALHDVYMEVDFTDAAERTATRRYLLVEQFDDTSSASMDDVIAQAEDVLDLLNLGTWDAIGTFRLCLEWVPPGEPSANIAANNQVTAAIRATTDDGEKVMLEIPSWDDTVFDQNSQNMLSAAFTTIVATPLIALLRDPITKVALSSVEYVQSRTRKSRNVIKD